MENRLPPKFSKGVIAIYWMTTVLILALFPLGEFMEGLSPTEKLGLIQIHAILGIIVFLLTLARSYLFFKSPRPDDLKTGSKFNDKLAVWIHNTFYFLLIGISVSGLATMFTGGYVGALKSGSSDLENIGSLKAHGVLATTLMMLLVFICVKRSETLSVRQRNALKRIS